MTQTLKSRGTEPSPVQEPRLARDFEPAAEKCWRPPEQRPDRLPLAPLERSWATTRGILAGFRMTSLLISPSTCGSTPEARAAATTL